MLDTNHCLSLEPSPPGSPPKGEDMEKAGMMLDHDRHVYHSLKEGGQAITKTADLSLHAGLYWYGFVHLTWSMESIAESGIQVSYTSAAF